MKYSEFEKLMENAGYKVHDNGLDITVQMSDGSVVSCVAKDTIGVVDLDWLDYAELSIEARKFVADICMELTFTPHENREEEEEKYYLRQIGIGSWSFLNFNINSQEYIVAGKKDDYTYKTQFTQSEIDDMPECYTHPAVWEKIKVEDAKNEN